MQTSVAGSLVIQFFPARSKPVQFDLPAHDPHSGR